MPRADGFLCYAHAGGKSPSRKFVEELQKHLRQIETDHDHVRWSDQNIRDGEDWPTRLRAALDRAAYAVLFVNIELIDSEFVREVELPALLKAAEDDGLLLLALRVGTCKLPDWLARLQFSNHEDTPLGATRSRETRDRAYTAVAERVEEHLRGGPAPSQSVRLMQQMVPPIASGTSSPSLTGSSAATDDPRLTDLADAMSQITAKDFDDIRERYLQGDRAGAMTGIDELLALPTWDHLAASLRGRILRTAALYRLHFRQDPAKAAELAERAKAEDPDGDDQPLMAHLALHRGDRSAALALLAEPRSPQARHLKAGILIEDGDAEKALGVLRASAEGTADAPDAAHQSDTKDADGSTAETWRLRALALVLQKQLPDALAAIHAARALAPHWIAVRGAAAVIEFWRACTTTALEMTEQPLWPMPFPRALVRADGGERLVESADTFADVAEALPAGSHEELQWLTWRLAALIAAGKGNDETSTLARRLLAGDGPPPMWPLVWAQYHGLDLDRDELKRRLAAVPDDDPNAVLFRGLYLELRLEDGEAEQVLAELPELAHLPVERGLTEVPRQWEVAALTTAGKLDDAERVADEVADEPLRLRLRLLIARKREYEQPGSHKAAAAALFAVDPGTDVLAEACEAHARAGDWAFVVEHADALLAAVPTPNSLRLLAMASFHQGQYQRCMTALDEHRSNYPSGRLPPDLTLLRVRCQRALGDSSVAIREARALYDELPTAEHLVELLNAQLEAADSGGIRDSLHRLTLIEPADSQLLLQGARVAAPLDRDLAKLLLQRAVPAEVEDAALVAQAAVLAESLGLGADQTGPWFQRMREVATVGTGAVRMLHISELPEIMRQQREATAFQMERLSRAEIPLHVLLGHGQGVLPGILHGQPEHNRADPDPLLQPPILIRHGARPLRWPKPKLDPRPRLNLDLTALITARSLGLLDRVEQAFGPLSLHRQWHLLLQAEVDRARPPQPRRAQNHAELEKLVRCGAIKLVDADTFPAQDEALTRIVGDVVAREIQWVRSNSGVLLTYLPLHRPDIEHWQEVDLPTPWREVVIGPRALLAGLLGEGLIDGDVHEQALADFPAEPEASTAMGLHPKDAVLLGNPILLGQFAELSLLSTLSHRFQLQLTTHEWEREQQEAESNRHRAELARWIEALIEHVAPGREDGRYRIVPAAGPEPEGGLATYAGLGDLLSQPGEPGDLLWADDRYLNSYLGTGRMPIIGVVDVLNLLREAGALSREHWYEELYRLRASNYRYIPLAADEIQHWLARAHEETGQLIAPPQLDVLARYWAACLYPRDVLKWNSSERHPNGEMPFFVSSQSAIGTALRAIWSDARLNTRQRKLRADWLLDNLYVGIADIAHLLPSPSPERAMNLVGTDLAGLCFGAFQVMFERIERDCRLRRRRRSQGTTATDRALDAAEEYLRWACDRILMSRLRADPESVQTTARALRGLLLAKAPGDDGDRLLLFGKWMLRFLPVLPRALRDELHKDQDLMGRLELAEVAITEVHVRIPRHSATCSSNIRPAIPPAFGHPFHGHSAGAVGAKRRRWVIVTRRVRSTSTSGRGVCASTRL